MVGERRRKRERERGRTRAEETHEEARVVVFGAGGGNVDDDGGGGGGDGGNGGGGRRGGGGGNRGTSEGDGGARTFDCVARVRRALRARMRGCVSSRQRFRSNCSANAALRGERESPSPLSRCRPSRSLPTSVPSSPLSLSLGLSFSLSARAPGSRPGRDRFERSRRPSSARPRPDVSRSLSLSFSRAGRSLFPHRRCNSVSLSPSFFPSPATILSPSIYIHTLPPPASVLPLLAHLRGVSIERASRELSRPSPARMSTTRQRRRPRLESAIIDVSYRGDSPTSSDFGTLLSAASLPCSSPRARSRSLSPVVTFFFFFFFFGSHRASDPTSSPRNHPSRVPLKTVPPSPSQLPCHSTSP